MGAMLAHDLTSESASFIVVFLAAMIGVASGSVWIMHEYSTSFWPGFALVMIGYVWGSVVTVISRCLPQGKP